MKSTNELKLSSQNDREHQLYHKHTFGSVGNLAPISTNMSASFSNISHQSSNFSQSSQGSIAEMPQTFEVVQIPTQPSRKLSNASLSTAISSLTYGLSCLIYEPQWNEIYECLVMVHEEYINILHLIINREISYLLKLNEVKSVDVEDTFISGQLAVIAPQFRDNFIVFNLKTLDTIVLVFKTQTERDIIYMGLKFFLVEGRQFYEKLSQYDPFRAESMMLFLEADKDGGNLLDIEEILSILGSLKINKEKLDIESDVLEINKSLYERENIKRPKNASSSELTPLAFEYLLRYYSTKQELTKFFKEYCPMFKPKNKNHKNTIIDCIKNNQKPIMSSVQLKVFYQEILNETKTEDELNEVIRKFPLYDGQGKQKFQHDNDEPLLNFDNFCNLICSSLNCLHDLNDKKYGFNKKPDEDSDLLVHKSMVKSTKSYFSHTLLDYYIYCDLSIKNPKRKEKSNFYTLALKRGVKCITLPLTVSLINHSKDPIDKKKNKNQTSKLSAIVVRIDEKQKEELFVEDILHDVKTLAFDKNKLPFWIVFDIYELFKLPNYAQYLELLADIIDQCLQKENIFVNLNPKDDKKNILPSPLQLENKFVLLSNFNAKMIQKISGNKNDSYQIPKSFSRKMSFPAVKLDFERKGQNCWNSCFIEQDMLKSYESAEEENISNYAKKVMLFYVRKNEVQSSNIDAFSCFRQGIHFVGEDFEKNKEAPYVIHSKFSQVPEEAFGYLLKPAYMHTQNSSPLYTNKNFTRAQMTKIKFNILSGQKLILNDLPYGRFHVETFVKGGISDNQNNKVYKSDKKTEGFYTQIGLECEFVVYNEEMYTIVVLVRNSENGKILAGRAVSLNRIREGLRTLQLFNDRMQTKENSYLLIHYTKKQIHNKDDKVNKMQEFLK